MQSISSRKAIEASLPTVIEILRYKNSAETLELLTTSQLDVQQTGMDNWDGGTELWTLTIRVPVPLFVRIEKDRETHQGLISDAIKSVVGENVGFWISVEIAPQVANIFAAENPDGTIRAETRNAVIDELRARETVWHGALDEIGFLSRMFDLSALPSHDSRFDTAEGDIWQHCVNNYDWELDWIYSDRRFALYSMPQERFLKFICEILHPVVRREAAEQEALALAFNNHLQRDGWELVEDVLIQGRPVYVPRRKIHALGSSLGRIQSVAASLNSQTLYQDLRRLEGIGDSDPALAIGLAKELVETCCKTILDDRKIPYSEDVQLPKLVKMVREEVRVMPEHIDENAKANKEIKGILSSLGTIAANLATVRNEYGTGHGKGRNYKGLEARHARLAIGAASTFVDFVMSRHLMTEKNNSKSN